MVLGIFNDIYVFQMRLNNFRQNLIKLSIKLNYIKNILFLIFWFLMKLRKIILVNLLV